MCFEEYLEFMAPDAIRLKGHRIGLEHVVELFHEGYSPEQIALEYPGVSLEKIYGVITYYLRNRAEVDAYMERLRALEEQSLREEAAREPHPAVQRIRALMAERERARENKISS